jgi:hypothetical protein
MNLSSSNFYEQKQQQQQPFIAATASSSVVTNNKRVDLFEKLESSPYNKSNWEQLRAMINFMEKKKYCYLLTLIPTTNEDRKATRRHNKIINNNKYILFNSWYTKIRQTEWPKSSELWKFVKNKSELANFVYVFNHIEKLGKKLSNKNDASSSSSFSSSSHKHQSHVDQQQQQQRKKNEAATFALDELKENNELRNKLYCEFYKVMSDTFKRDCAPLQSDIYDDVLTREFLNNAVTTFKYVALEGYSTPYTPQEMTNHATNSVVVNGKKRKSNSNSSNNSNNTNNTNGNNNKRIKARRQTATVLSPVSSVNYSMISDNAEDTNMSD